LMSVGERLLPQAYSQESALPAFCRCRVPQQRRPEHAVVRLHFVHA
jgi:hypothetical protein